MDDAQDRPLASPSYAADCALVARVCAGDRAAWADLVQVHAPTLRFALIRTLARHGVHASETLLEDLEGDLTLRLVARDFRKLRRYSGRCSLRQWLKVVAGNFAIDHLRRRRPLIALRTVPQSDDAPPEPGVMHGDQLVSDAPGPDERLDDRRRRRAIAQMLGELNDEDRLFVELYYARGLGYEQVAELMGTTVGAVYQRKNRIRKRLTAMARAADLIASG